MINYEKDSKAEQQIRELASLLELRTNRIFCIRSRGSASKRIVARCHALSKALQSALGVEPAYVIELLEPFEKLSEEEKVKTLIHELLHIPKAFGGGFKGHRFVTKTKIERIYEKFQLRRSTKDLNRPEH